jgi:hypothetical protein
VSSHAPLQIIVDSLAADIERDVAVDDRQIRWLVSRITRIPQV